MLRIKEEYEREKDRRRPMEVGPRHEVLPPLRREGGGAVSADRPVLDACCGGESFYFREHPEVLTCDLEPRVATLCDGRAFECAPDVVCDFTDLPFDDETFSLVVFDPPHLTRGAGWQATKYGVLDHDWKDELGRGFSECWRVLRPQRTLVFKWSDVQVGLAELRPLFPAPPLLGNRRPRASGTHWLLFFKGGESS